MSYTRIGTKKVNVVRINLCKELSDRYTLKNVETAIKEELLLKIKELLDGGFEVLEKQFKECIINELKTGVDACEILGNLRYAHPKNERATRLNVTKRYELFKYSRLHSIAQYAFVEFRYPAGYHKKKLRTLLLTEYFRNFDYYKTPGGYSTYGIENVILVERHLDAPLTQDLIQNPPKDTEVYFVPDSKDIKKWVEFVAQYRLNTYKKHVILITPPMNQLNHRLLPLSEGCVTVLADHLDNIVRSAVENPTADQNIILLQLNAMEPCLLVDGTSTTDRYGVPTFEILKQLNVSDNVFRDRVEAVYDWAITKTLDTLAI